jgi:putative CocE/NonD family hydrolase
MALFSGRGKLKIKRNWHELVSQPKYGVSMTENVRVNTRDGTPLYVDVYRPASPGRFPALVSFSSYGKDSQKLPTHPYFQPSDYVRGTGGHEGGEQSYFVPRGYVQVIPDARGVGKSKGEFTADPWQDGYDLIEWAAEQPWCNGKVGMLGMSSFAIAQYLIAARQPPHLHPIFPFEGLTDWYRHHYYHGGIFNYYFQLHMRNLMPLRNKLEPGSLNEFNEQELRSRIDELQRNPDIQCTPYLYLITTRPEMNPAMFDLLLHPYDGPYYQKTSPCRRFKDIKVPAFLGSRWNGWAVHLAGAFDAFNGIGTPKEHRKLMIVSSNNYGGMDRPFHEVQDVCLRWYDHWLNENDTGIMSEPPILVFIQGVNKWRYEKEWPLSVTRWTKVYLREKGGLSLNSPGVDENPQVFTNDPWANPTQGFGRADVISKADFVPKAVYETKTLPENLEVTGPIALYWFASIRNKGVHAKTWRAQEAELLEPIENDTDWYVKLKDIAADGAERYVAEGWLKASHYELDESVSQPYAPYHLHTRKLPIESGQMVRYACDLRMTSNVFLAGHRVRLELAAQDQVQALWYHLPHMATVEHTVYSSGDHASYLLLPVIPKGYDGAGEPPYPPDGPFRIG